VSELCSHRPAAVPAGVRGLKGQLGGDRLAQLAARLRERARPLRHRQLVRDELQHLGAQVPAAAAQGSHVVLRLPAGVQSQACTPWQLRACRSEALLGERVRLYLRVTGEPGRDGALQSSTLDGQSRSPSIARQQAALVLDATIFLSLCPPRSCVSYTAGEAQCAWHTLERLPYPRQAQTGCMPMG